MTSDPTKQRRTNIKLKKRQRVVVAVAVAVAVVVVVVAIVVRHILHLEAGFSHAFTNGRVESEGKGIFKKINKPEKRKKNYIAKLEKKLLTVRRKNFRKKKM